MRRGTTNANARGNVEDRRRRREWLVFEFGDGELVKCATCPAMLDVESVTVDRYPIPGCEGGTYRRGNIRPMCGPCNSTSGGCLGAARAAAKRALSSSVATRAEK